MKRIGIPLALSLALSSCVSSGDLDELSTMISEQQERVAALSQGLSSLQDVANDPAVRDAIDKLQADWKAFLENAARAESTGPLHVVGVGHPDCSCPLHGTK